MMKVNWGTGVTIVFILFALGMATMVIIAMGSNVNLERSDYYQEEIDFQNHIDKVKNAEKLQKLITLSFNTQEQMIELQFPQKLNSTEGIIHFFRPSDNHLDKKITLSLDQGNKQKIPFSFLNKKGLWRVKIDWNGDGKDFFVEKVLVID